MTILVTGGTGLVGSRLLPRLIESGHACRGLVRQGKDLPAGVTPVVGDLLEAASLADAVKGVTAIVHLAATFRTPDGDLVRKVNIEGTRNLVAAAREHAPKARFIMASTGLVYGTEGTHPGREDDEVHPTLAYPASKVVAEKALRESGLNWAILRLAFVYGDKDGHLEGLPKRAGQLGWHPAAKLSLIHHRDIAACVGLALAGTLDGRILNVTDDASMSIYELCQLAGQPIAPSAQPLENPWWGQMDGSLARSLGFRAAVPTIHQAKADGVL